MEGIASAVAIAVVFLLICGLLALGIPGLALGLVFLGVLAIAGAFWGGPVEKD